MVRLEPRFHFLLERAGEKADVFAKGDHGARDRNAVVVGVIVVRLVERAGGREERLAGAGFAVAREHVDAVVEERIHEKLLLKVARTDGDAAGGFDEIGEFEAAHDAIAIITRGHGFTFVGAEQHVFVEIKRFAGDGAEVEGTFGTEALELVEAQRDLAVAEFLVGLGDFVVEVIFGLEADGAGLELDVYVFGNENGGRLILLLDEERGGDDAVIFFGKIGQNRAEAFHRGGAARGIGEVGINDNGERATVGEFDALVHGAGVGQELLQDAVDAAGVAAALGGLLAFDRIEFLEDLDGDGEVVVLEFIDRLRVVKEDIRVEHEGLHFDRNPVPLTGSRGSFNVFHQYGREAWRQLSKSPATCP